MTRRKLTKAELDLWHQVAQSAERMHPDRGTDTPWDAETPPAFLPSEKPTGPKPAPIAPFQVGARANSNGTGHVLKPETSQLLAQAPLNMDRKTLGRLSRGKMKPEARLDLHGMRLDDAHPALTRFILRAQAQGRRLVLVITGKGKDRDEPGPIPVPRGILRNQVPQWLMLPPLAQAVLQVTPAHGRHGGDGAFYVYLRRMR